MNDIMSSFEETVPWEATNLPEELFETLGEQNLGDDLFDDLSNLLHDDSQQQYNGSLLDTILSKDMLTGATADDAFFGSTGQQQPTASLFTTPNSNDTSTYNSNNLPNSYLNNNITSSNNNTIHLPEDPSFDAADLGKAFNFAEIVMSPKHEQDYTTNFLSPKREDCGSSVNTLTDARVNSPSYSYTSDGWDSGVSAGVASPNNVHLDQQQLSPPSDFGVSSTLLYPTGDSVSPNSSQLGTPQRSPITSSGYQSSSSPPSSPDGSCGSSTSSGRSPSVSPNGSPDRNVSVPSVSSSDIVQSSRQCYIAKRTLGTQQQNNKFTNISSKNIKIIASNGNVLNSSNLQPVTVLSNGTNLGNGTMRFKTVQTSSATSGTTSKIVPHTVFNRCQQVYSNGSVSNNNATFTTTKCLQQQKSSPSPSVGSLSGVNKTAGGIIKSPSVLNVNRKQHQVYINSSANSTLNFSNSVVNNSINLNSSHNNKILNNISTTATINTSINSTTNLPGNNINVITTASQLNSSSSNNTSTPIYKTVTLSNNGRLTSSGQQIIIDKRHLSTFAKNGKINKGNTKGPLYIPISIQSKDMEKLKTFKIIANPRSSPNTTSGTSGTLLQVANGAGHTFITVPNRPKLCVSGVSTMTSSPGLRTTNVSILKNFGMAKSLQRVKDGDISGLVAVPKEENMDSDDEIDMQTKTTHGPLVLSEEEKKIAMKENKKFPSHYPLNPKQEKDLRGIKRKIRNKISAQESRKRKKEYVDKLEEKLNVNTQEVDKIKTERETFKGERDRLRLQLSNKEETIRKLSEQLKKFQTLMNSHQHAPSVSHTGNHSNTRQQQPSTFLLMMLLSAALFIYPSMMPQGKIATELLTSGPHKMPPAGNSRTLLEAAKLSVCPEDSFVEDELDIIESKVSIAALNDHDYTPPMKRGRFSLSMKDDDSYCSIPTAFGAPDPPREHAKKLSDTTPGDGGETDSDDDDSGTESWPDSGGIKLGSNKGEPFSSFTSQSDVLIDSPPSQVLHLKEEIVDLVEEYPVKTDPDILSEQFSQDAIDSMMRSLESNHNWTESGGRQKERNGIDALAKSLIVELTSNSGVKRFGEDTELE